MTPTPSTGRVTTRLSTRYAAAAVLAAVEVSLAVLLLLPWGHNTLQGWDLVWHLDAAVRTQQQVFPGLFGWNDAQFFGLPLNQFYPPLPTWCAAALGLLFGAAWALRGIVNPTNSTFSADVPPVSVHQQPLIGQTVPMRACSTTGWPDV